MSTHQTIPTDAISRGEAIYGHASASNNGNGHHDPAGPACIRVVVADDHIMVRQGLCGLLNATEGIEVVGEASNGSDAADLVNKLLPDVVVLDVRMTGLNGADAAMRIQKDNPSVGILAISAHEEVASVGGMFRAGARGYVLKDTAVSEILRAVRLVAGGGFHVCPRVMQILIECYVLGQGESESWMWSVLTTREREVAQLLSEGLSTRHIAKQLHVSVKTIDTHRHQVLKKLDLRGIADLTRLALREGLTTLET